MPCVYNNARIVPWPGKPLKHRYVAKLLGIRPKDLTQLPLRRVLYQKSYAYDPSEISSLIQNRTTNPND